MTAFRQVRFHFGAAAGRRAVRSSAALTAALVTAALLASALSTVPAAGAEGECSVVRFASSSNRIYVGGGSTCTIEQLSARYPSRVVAQGSGAYLATANLFTENGGAIHVHGPTAGGTVTQLRLKSANDGTANAVVELTADWGTIDIRGTTVTSWNPATSGPDTTYDATSRRSWVRARSRSATAESTMNIVDSEIRFLGYYAAESYGLVWKVMNGDFATTDVLGEVRNSSVHHLYFGFYSYGADAMAIVDSEFAYNVGYGIDPHDDSDNLTITGNNSHHNGNHGIICSQRCNNLTITGNTSSNNVGHGIMLHRSTDNSVVADNTIVGNTDAGIALFESNQNTVSGNVLTGNRNSIRLSVGSSYNTFSNNVITSSTLYGIYAYKGSDAPARPGNDGRNRYNTFTDNVVSNPGDRLVKFGDSPDNTFTDNDFRLVAPNANKVTFSASKPANAATFTTANLFAPGVAISGL